MPRAKDYLQPEVQDLSATERNESLADAKSDAEWQDEQAVDRAKGPTSSHEDKGWRSLKPF